MKKSMNMSWAGIHNESSYTEYTWLTLSGARVRIVLDHNTFETPTIDVLGNPQGFVSLVNIFLWLTGYSYGYEILSLSGISFVELNSPLTLCVRVIDDEISQRFSGHDGRIVRLDKHVQYQWEISDEQLQGFALELHKVACNPWAGHIHVELDNESDAALNFFTVTTDDVWRMK